MTEFRCSLDREFLECYKKEKGYYPPTYYEELELFRSSQNAIVKKLDKRFNLKYINTPIWLFRKKDISPTEKTIYSCILSLDKIGGCFASNEYFADLLGLTDRRVCQILGSLERKGYIIRKIKREKGNFNVTRREIKPIKNELSEIK